MDAMTAPRLTGGERDIVAPVDTDPLARAVSGAWGGPRGSHGRSGGRWWSPLTVIILIASLMYGIGVLGKAACVTTDFNRLGYPYPYTHMCYSDIEFLYVGRDLARGTVPYRPVDRPALEAELRANGQLNGLDPAQVRDAVDRAVHDRTIEYPVLTGAYMGVMAALTHVVGIGADLSSVSYNDLQSNKSAQHDAAVFWDLNVIGFFVVLLIALVLLVRAQPRRPWDALLVAAAPVIALDSGINWDLLAIGFVAAALHAWSRRRPVLAGVAIGLGTSTKLYPLFMLGPMLVLCVRERRYADFAKALAGAVVSWLAVNLPVYLWSPTAWKWFWEFNRERDGQYGSIWYVLTLHRSPVSAGTINSVSLVVFALCCGGVLALGLLAPRRPRLVSLVFLVIACFLLVNKVYSPQYALWLLPFAALARPRWRDLLIWQSCEAFYFFAVWMQIGAAGMKAGDNGAPIDFVGWYTLATGIRVAGTLYLMAIVVRDILRPWLDPVRSDGLTDDPLGGVLDRGLDAELDQWDDEPGRSQDPAAVRLSG
jgi:uncharacterized membrane protein